MTIGIMQEQNLEKQIGKQVGCMAGFLQIFDRHQTLTGKRLYSTKRLPPSPASETTSEDDKAFESPLASRELEKQPQGLSAPSPDCSKQSPVISELLSPAPEPLTLMGNQNKASVPLPIFELKEGSAKSPWKFSKEAPRLSLDSRAVVDAAKGSLKPREIRTNQCKSNSEDNGVDDSDKRQSPSVIARLMGLGSFPNSHPEAADGKLELRRSASEARGRDLFQHRLIDEVNFQLKQRSISRENGVKQDHSISDIPENLRNARAEPIKAPVRGISHRKCFYDSADFFPEPKQTGSIYGEMEKRLKLRGIDEAPGDIETLKQILEALQLKGLLHARKQPNQTNNKNFVYEQEQSPITVTKPGRSLVRRIGNDSPPSSNRSRPGSRRNLSNEVPPTMSPRRNRSENERNQRNSRGSISPTRNACGVRSPSRRSSLSVETQRGNCNVEQRRVESPVQSPRVNVRRTGLNQTTNRSPRSRKSTAEIYHKQEKMMLIIPAEDEISSVSECSISTSCQTEISTERLKVEEYKQGRRLLERCDKLLHSIAEMTATTELHPSPVSVLDSSFYEESSLSPVKKRIIDFKEDDTWSPTALSSDGSKSEDKSDDCDFIYISDILRASNYLPDDSDVFLLLEKQHHLKGKDTSKVSRLQRKLIFDTINEILNRKRKLPAWITSTNSGFGHASLRQIWSEFQKIRERDSSDDLFEVICGVLRKDLAGDALNGWGDYPVEMSESVLDIERLIFKDLIVETILNLAAISGISNKIPTHRRKLVF